MGHVSCGRHGCRCCWKCDRCPRCEPDTGKLLRGDYCRRCTDELRARGFVWSAYFQDWVEPQDAAMNKKFGWEDPA